MYEPGVDGLNAPSARISMKWAPVSGENSPAWSIPARRASATVGYRSAAARAATSWLASVTRVAGPSGRFGIFDSAYSSVLHEPGAAPAMQLRTTAGVFVPVAVCPVPILTTFVVAVRDAATAYETAAVTITSAAMAAATGSRRRGRVSGDASDVGTDGG